MINILDELPSKSINNFIYRCSNIPDIDYQFVYKIAKLSIKYYKGNKDTRKYLRDGQLLESRWYKSLQSGSPDYSIYNTDYYLGDLWACWVVYSRQYLRQICNKNSLTKGFSIYNYLGDIKTVIDLGCGIGYTTAALKQLFPLANVFGTNILDSKQFSFCEQMAKEYDFVMLSSIKETNSQPGLIFASEYFEHFEEPIVHLIEVLSTKPKALLIANAFGAKSIGHFNIYKNNGSLFDGKTISKIFNKTLNEYGYKKIKTKLWNNRPSLWILSSSL